jgi:hypothetical protein
VLAWLRPVWSTTDDLIIKKCGFDAFLFLRYLRMMLKVFLPVTFVVIPVLAPINHYSGENEGVASLDVFSISNVAPQYAASRLWIHLALGTLVVVWVCYVIHDETLAYIKAKQRYTSGRDYRSQPSANTILVANIPKTLLTDEKLKKVFDVFPGGVGDIYINRDKGNLSSMLSTRDQVVEAIEVAETKLIVLCISRHTGVQHGLKRSIWTPRNWFDICGKRETSQARTSCSRTHDLLVEDDHYKDRPLRLGLKLGSEQRDNLTTSQKMKSTELTSCTVGSDRDAGAVWRRYVRPQERETTRLPVFAKSWFPSLPFLGRRVDRIHHLRDRLQKLNEEIKSSRGKADDYALLSNAFVRFNDQIAAHIACQSVLHSAPHRMAPRILDVDPKDVIWDNLALGWRQRWVRVCISLSASTCLIVLYAVPVAFTSFIANLDALASNVSWLLWLADWPDPIKSVVQVVLPPALLQVILLLVPVVYRYLMHLQGAPTGNVRELGVQTWYFLFLFVQVSESSVNVPRQTR